MLRRLGPQLANLLTALRLLLTPVFIALVGVASGADAAGVLAVIVFAVVAASDVWDGRVARRWGSESSGGRVFDHFADIGFIVPALCAYVWLGLAPWWVPAAIAAAFAFYVIDSRVRRNAGPRNLIGSRIGHVGGVCNYVLIGVLVCNNSAGIQLLSPAFLKGLYCLVPLYSLAAVVARLATQRGVPAAVRTHGDVEATKR